MSARATVPDGRRCVTADDSKQTDWAKSGSTGSIRRKEGDAYAQVTDFVRARFLSAAGNTRNVVGAVRGQPISLVLGGKSRRDQVVLLFDLGAMP
jgi:hypothetical protein